MEMRPKSWLDKLLSAAVVLALSAWLIRWTVVTLRPLLPLFIILGLGIAAIWIIAASIRRRRYW